MSERPMYVLNFEAERVESTYDPIDGFRATVAIPLATLEASNRKPMLVTVRVSPLEIKALDPDGLGEALDAICTTRADRKIRAVLAGEAMPVSHVESLGPMTPHDARAAALVETMRTGRGTLEALHGPEWMRILLESELRATYADGENKGYAIGVAMASAEAERFAEEAETLPPSRPEPVEPKDIG